MTAPEATAPEGAPADTPTATAASTRLNSATELAVLRDRLVTHAHRLSEIELRYLVQELGLAAESEPKVTRYEGGRYKLSTDPAEMPPYGPPLTAAEYAEEIREGITAMDRGEGIPAREVLARLRAHAA